MGGGAQSISYTKLPPCPSMNSRATAQQARQAPPLRVSLGNLWVNHAVPPELRKLQIRSKFQPQQSYVSSLC